MVTNNKAELRQQYRKIRQNLTADYLEQVNTKLTQKLIQWIEKNRWKTVGFYFAINHEVVTQKAIEFCLKKGLQVYLPYLENDQPVMTFKKVENLNHDLVQHPTFKFMQPVKTCLNLIDANQLDVLFIPILVFDELGNRLGSGAGYYDRWINDYHFQNLKVGLAQASQKTHQFIDAESHDLKLDYCLTEAKDFVFKKNK